MMADSPTQPPPQRALDILGHLGPGLIIAASIVGSGELIATTLTGAKAGISLLWLIVLGCIIKVFVQIEIGRFTLTTGIPTLSAMSLVPGPRIRHRGNWLVWYWFLMWFCSIAQLGGIAGACGQLLALAIPITSQGKEHLEIRGAELRNQINESADKIVVEPKMTPEQIAVRHSDFVEKYPSKSNAVELEKGWDDRLWAIPVAILTSWLLIIGRYSLIQTISTALVATFTFVTIGNVFRLQMLPEWNITSAEILYGLSFHLPTTNDWRTSVMMAMAVVGVIGVGAAELVQYPYWCIEKGYTRWTGRDDGTDAWVYRARGWLRVMKIDAWVSMLIYTLATIGFYMLGVAILHKTGIQPAESTLLQTLSLMYEPVLSKWAPSIFFVGAFAVLYSTFYVANASHARTFTDGLCVMGFLKEDPAHIRRSVTVLSGLFPMLCLAVYWVVPEPGSLVFLSGAAQAIMLPMMCVAAIYFRYYRCHPKLQPNIFSDTGLWISTVIMAAVGIFSLFTQGSKLLTSFLKLFTTTITGIIALCAISLVSGCQPLSEPIQENGTSKASTNSIPLRVRGPFNERVIESITKRWESYSDQKLDLQTWTLGDQTLAIDKKIPADILIVPSCWIGTLAERGWIQRLPESLRDLLPQQAHLKRLSEYGQVSIGIPLGINLLVHVQNRSTSEPEPNDSEHNDSELSDSGVNHELKPQVEQADDLADQAKEESENWIVDRFLVYAAAHNPDPRDLNLLFKSLGFRSRLKETWLHDAARELIAANLDSLNDGPTKQWRKFMQATTLSNVDADFLVSTKHLLGWPDEKVDVELEVNLKQIEIKPQLQWVDSGRTLIATFSTSNRQSAASESFLRWFDASEQRSYFAGKDSAIRLKPQDAPTTSVREDCDRYQTLIGSAIESRDIIVELNFDNASEYRNELAQCLRSIAEKSAEIEAAFDACHVRWEAISDRLGRQSQQTKYYRALGMDLWK